MNQLLIATNNPGKAVEIKNILSLINVNVKLISPEDIKIESEVIENGKTFRENAILKAVTIGKKTGMLTLAEDSGLEVDALKGRPGVYSARYCKGSDKDRVDKLLKELSGVPNEKRTARFRAAVAVYNPLNKKIITFEGSSEGIILEKPKGNNGFGYDPVFFNTDLGKTNAQATLKEKNRVSHRGRALSKAVKIMPKLLSGLGKQNKTSQK